MLKNKDAQFYPSSSPSSSASALKAEALWANCSSVSAGAAASSSNASSLTKKKKKLEQNYINGCFFLPVVVLSLSGLLLTHGE
jgi:hypothetical protein